MKTDRLIFQKILLGILFFISIDTYSNIIWRTTNIGYSESFMSNEMRNAANNTFSVTGSTFYDIDIDQNGTNDFRVSYKVDNMVGSNTMCTEGLVTSNHKQFRWFLDKTANNTNTGIYSTKSAFGYIIDGNTVWLDNLGLYSLFGLVTYERRIYTPYPSARCVGMSEGILLSNAPSNDLCGGSQCFSNELDDFYFGVSFIRNGAVHMCWMKFSLGIITEIAWEDTPFFPLRIGDKNSVLNHGILQYATVSGQAFIDANSNCTLDANEKVLPNMPVSIKNTTYKAITNAQGYYVFYLPYENGAVYELDVKVKNTYGSVGTTCNTLTLPVITTNGQSIVKNIAITPSACANVEVKINSNPLRRCFRSSFTVEYRNTGTVAAAGRQIKVVIPTWLRAISSSPAWTSQSNDTLIYNIATLNGLSSGQIRVIDSVVCGEEMIRGMDQCIKAFVEPNQSCVLGNVYTDADVHVSGACESGIVKIKIKNTGASMSESAEYRVLLDRDLVKSTSYQLASGASFTFDVPTHGKTSHIEVDQIVAHPILKYRVFALEGCGDFIGDNISKGIIHTQSSVREGNTESTVCTTILDSYDPNDKLATPGEGLILPNQDIYYTIRFQNTGTASAINVVVDDTLSANLDIRTLSIVGTSHPQVMSNYILDVNGKKVLKFTFYNINLVKQSTSEALSQGYITYKISQNIDLPIGTLIKNKAFIYFDFNSAIITNETIHEVGIPVNDALLKVTTALENKEACTGDNVALGITSLNERAYAWYKNEELIENEVSALYSILSLSSANEGTYTCKVIGLMDTITTTSIVSLKTPSACGVNSVQDKNRSNFKLYPNPAKLDLIIESVKAGTYSIVDMYGLVVLKGELNVGVNVLNLVQNLKQGSYLVTIKTSEDVVTERLIVQ